MRLEISLPPMTYFRNKLKLLLARKSEIDESTQLSNNLKRDPLETQPPKFENSRLGFIESVHER